MFALLPDGALRPGVRRREVFGWALYDFANSGYTTVVLTAVFSAYFVSAVAGAASWATLLWTLAIGLSNAIVMLLMPALGAWADQRAAKGRFLSHERQPLRERQRRLTAVLGCDRHQAIAADMAAHL